MAVAFRCKSCGHLQSPESAGENAVPHACCVCGKGVTLGMPPMQAHKLIVEADTPEKAAQAMAVISAAAGEKTFQPDNWEVLSDATPKRLKELGLTVEQVARHTEQTGLVPGATPRVGRHIKVDAEG